MIDERDRAIAMVLRGLHDGLPPRDWAGVVALAAASGRPAVGAPVTDGPTLEDATPVLVEPSHRRRSARAAGLVAAAAVLTLAVVVAGFQGIRSSGRSIGDRPGATTTPIIVHVDPRVAFRQILNRLPSTGPKVLELMAGFEKTLPGAIAADVDVAAPREMPSPLGSPLYMIAGSRYVCFLGRATGGGCTTLASAADAATPALWLGNAADDTLVVVALVPDTVARMTVLTADGRSVDLDVAGNVASARLSDRPARVLTTLSDGTTLRHDFDLTFPADDMLPATREFRHAGDRSLAFARANPALIAAVGPAVVAGGVVELPAAVQAKIDLLNEQLADCLAAHGAQPLPELTNPLPTDTDGTLAKVCPAQTAAIDAYAISPDLNAAGVVRRLTSDALDRCSRLGRLPEGATPPPDGAMAVAPPAVMGCREQVVGHLPPFPKPG